MSSALGVVKREGVHGASHQWGGGRSQLLNDFCIFSTHLM